MDREAIEKKLYDAASKGEVTKFRQLLQQDPYLLDVVSFACSRNLLHIAAMCGQQGIVEEVLRINPRLAWILDSQKLSPLHIAVAQGHVEIATKLIAIAPETCWWRDCHDMNPIHIAAMNGHVEILDRLIQESPLPAMDRLQCGETVLHLCVKHRQLRALEVLVKKFGDLVDATNHNSETLLHLAVRSNQLEIIQCLARSNKIKKQTKNCMGKTELEILNESPPEATSNYREIRRILISLRDESVAEGVKKMAEMTMVVAILIATMAFQAAGSPPGGVWQDDTTSHKAGEAVMASTHPTIYKQFVVANIIAFVSSLVTIFLVTIGLPSLYFLFLKIVVFVMWASLASIAVSYGGSVTVITPNTNTQSLVPIIRIVGIVLLSILALMAAYFNLHKLYSSWKERRRWHEHLRPQTLMQCAFFWIFDKLFTWG